MVTLTPDQQRDFARNGFLVLEDWLDSDRVAEARGAVKADPEITVDDGQNEPAGATEVFRDINRRLYELVEALVGDRPIKHPDDPDFGTYDDEQCRIYVRSPGAGVVGDPSASEDPKVAVHTDDQTDGAGALSVLNAGIYLDDVTPRQGGFSVWPGSHWITAEHCELEPTDESAPEGTRGRAPNLQIRADSPFEDVDELLGHAELFEITGAAGAVILWHPGLVHASGIHRRPGQLRLTAFSRFHVSPGHWTPADRDHPFTLLAGIDPTTYEDVESEWRSDR